MLLLRSPHRGPNGLPKAITSKCFAMQRALLHDGKATVLATHLAQPNQNQEEEPSNAFLWASNCTNSDHKPLAVTRIGVGDPYWWDKQVPRIDSSKELILSKQSNFVQARFNPFQPGVLDPIEEVYAETVAVSELVMENGLDRQSIVVSALIDDDLMHRSTVDPFERVSSETVSSAVQTALLKWDVLTLDHLTYRLPKELVAQVDSPKARDAITKVADTLQGFCQKEKLQSFGFGLPRNLTDSTSGLAINQLDLLLECLEKATSHHDGFTSLQYTTNLGQGIPLPDNLKEFCKTKKLLRIGENIFDARLANGKPFRLKNHFSHSGEEIAQLLRKSFELAINLERKYHETLMPKFQDQGFEVPPPDDVAWAHILASQNEQFDNFEEWNYVRETQILPRVEQTLQVFKQLDEDETRDFGFAYSVLVNDLLKNFSLSLEHHDALRGIALVHEIGDPNCKTLEEVALVAALSGNADVVLLEHTIDNLAQLVEISQNLPFGPASLNNIQRITRRNFQE